MAEYLNLQSVRPRLLPAGFWLTDFEIRMYRQRSPGRSGTKSTCVGWTEVCWRSAYLTSAGRPLARRPGVGVKARLQFGIHTAGETSPVEVTAACSRACGWSAGILQPNWLLAGYVSCGAAGVNVQLRCTASNTSCYVPCVPVLWNDPFHCQLG